MEKLSVTLGLYGDWNVMDEADALLSFDGFLLEGPDFIDDKESHH